MDREIAPEVRRRRIARIAITMVIAIATIVFFLAATVQWLRPSVKRRDIQTSRVERGSVDATLQASGTVMPALEQVISSPVEARVLRILRQAGDRVKAGDELVALDTSATRLDVAKLNSQLQQKDDEDIDADVVPQLRHRGRIEGHVRDRRRASVRRRDPDDIREAELESRRIRLSVAAAPDMTASMDEQQFEQALLNVLRNAMEAIGNDGEIAITAAGDELAVTDTGPGISLDAASEIFTPFFTTKPDGNGLGLAIVQEILTNHGFAFSLRNRERQGAEFRISF